MAKVDRLENLNCWKAARELVKLIFEICDIGRLAKDLNGRSQLRRGSFVNHE
jgi:hypothetical protein